MRSIIFGVFQSLVVLLYILDNETNFVVQVSVFIGLLIDLWKITKVMDVKVRQETIVFSILYMICSLVVLFLAPDNCFQNISLFASPLLIL